MKDIIDHLWMNHQTKVRFVIVGIWNTVFGYLCILKKETENNCIISKKEIVLQL